MAKNDKKSTILDANQAISPTDMPEDAMRGELERGFEAVKTKNNAVESQRIAVGNQIKQLKMEMLQNFYKFLQDNGVDPNDLASINQFLQKLEGINPDFVTLFEFLLNGLAPEEDNVNPAGSASATEAPEISGQQTDTDIPSAGGAGSSSSNTGSSSNTDFLKRFDDLKRRNIIQ